MPGHYKYYVILCWLLFYLFFLLNAGHYKYYSVLDFFFFFLRALVWHACRLVGINLTFLKLDSQVCSG